MWYEYCDNAHLVTSVYTQVPSLDIFLLFEVQWQPSLSVIRLRGDVSRFPDASPDWVSPYNTAQIILEFSEIVVFEMSIIDPVPDLIVKVTIEKSNEDTLSLQVLSHRYKLRAYAKKSSIISLKKYISSI